MKHRLMPLAKASYNDSLQKLGMSEVDLGFYSGAGVSNCSMSPPPSQETLEAVKNSNPTGIALYNFTADEIGECESLTKAVKTWAKALHAYRGERAYETFYSQ